MRALKISFKRPMLFRVEQDTMQNLIQGDYVEVRKVKFDGGFITGVAFKIYKDDKQLGWFDMGFFSKTDFKSSTLNLELRLLISFLRLNLNPRLIIGSTFSNSVGLKIGTSRSLSLIICDVTFGGGSKASFGTIKPSSVS